MPRAGGCLSAMQVGYVGPTAYNFALSLQRLFGLVVGGMNSIIGALIGGVMLEFLPASSRASARVCRRCSMPCC